MELGRTSLTSPRSTRPFISEEDERTELTSEHSDIEPHTEDTPNLEIFLVSGLPCYCVDNGPYAEVLERLFDDIVRKPASKALLIKAIERIRCLDAFSLKVRFFDAPAKYSGATSRDTIYINSSLPYNVIRRGFIYSLVCASNTEETEESYKRLKEKIHEQLKVEMQFSQSVIEPYVKREIEVERKLRIVAHQILNQYGWENETLEEIHKYYIDPEPSKKDLREQCKEAIWEECSRATILNTHFPPLST